jgi:hypothetical protein
LSELLSSIVESGKICRFVALKVWRNSLLDIVFFGNSSELDLPELESKIDLKLGTCQKKNE